MWKKVLFFVALPSFIIGNVNPRYFVMEDGTETEPPYVPYDPLRSWTKRFSWGDGNQSLITKSQTNALPDGIEHKDETAIY